MGASATPSTGACSYRFSSHDCPRSALSGTLLRATFGRRTLAPRLSVKVPDGLREIRAFWSTSVGSLGISAQAMKLVNRSIPALFAEIDERSFATCGCFTIADIYLWHILARASGRAVALPDSVARCGERLARRSAMPDLLRAT